MSIIVNWRNCKELLKTNSVSDNERLLVRHRVFDSKIEIGQYCKADLTIKIDGKEILKDKLEFYLFIPEVDLITRGY